MTLPNLFGSLLRMRVLSVRLPTPWTPISTNVFRLNGGIRVTSSYKTKSALSYSPFCFDLYSTLRFFFEICVESKIHIPVKIEWRNKNWCTYSSAANTDLVNIIGLWRHKCFSTLFQLEWRYQSSLFFIANMLCLPPVWIFHIDDLRLESGFSQAFFKLM